MQRPLLTRSLPEHRNLQVGHYHFRPCKEAEQVPRVHDHGTMTYQFAGRSVFWMGSLYRLEPRDFLLIPSGAPHRLLEADGASVWGVSICTHCYASVCDGLLVRAFSEVAQGACAVRRVSLERHDWVCELFKRLAEETELHRPHQESMVQGLLSVLFAEVARAEQTSVSEQPPMNPLVAETLRYLELYACKPISLVDVASAMRRTTAYLTTLVKQHTGWTVMEWLTQLRMNEARRLLLHSDEFVDIVAERVGYTSPSHFHQLFRRLHQSTPAAWRRHHQHQRLGHVVEREDV